MGRVEERSWINSTLWLKQNLITFKYILPRSLLSTSNSSYFICHGYFFKSVINNDMKCWVNQLNLIPRCFWSGFGLICPGIIKGRSLEQNGTGLSFCTEESYRKQGPKRVSERPLLTQLFWTSFSSAHSHSHCFPSDLPLSTGSTSPSLVFSSRPLIVSLATVTLSYLRCVQCFMRSYRCSTPCLSSS